MLFLKYKLNKFDNIFQFVVGLPFLLMPVARFAPSSFKAMVHSLHEKFTQVEEGVVEPKHNNVILNIALLPDDKHDGQQFIKELLHQITLRTEVYITNFDAQVKFNEDEDQVVFILKKVETDKTIDELVIARSNVAEHIASLLYE